MRKIINHIQQSGEKVSILQFVRMVRRVPSTEVFANPYSCYDPALDAEEDSCRQRQYQLIRYLRYRKAAARVILVAEAPGYQGARFTGLAMTSERLLSGDRDILQQQNVFGRPDVYQRTSHIEATNKASVRERGFTEPTATIVWREIAAVGLHRQIVLWNTFPFHPHQLGNRLTNRRPTLAEIEDQAGILTALTGLFDHDCTVVSVGNVARDQLQQLGIQAQHVRHPANGGAEAFREGIQAVFNEF